MADVFSVLRDRLAPGEMAPWPVEADGSVPAGSLLDVLGIRCTHLGPGAARAMMPLAAHHLNQRGIVQGGAVVTLADATAGWATYCAVPDGHGFTTVALDANLLGAARAGDTLGALASPVHIGRSMVVLNVEVVRADQEKAPGLRRLVARLTCTQMILAPR